MKKLFPSLLLALALLAGAAHAQTITPQGRLTLSSATPVQTADMSGASTVYYDCYNGNVVPVGSSPSNLTIGSCEISMVLAAANVLSGSVYDIFGVSNSGTLVICVGPAWSSTTSRGTGAGTTELDQTNGGLWTNKNSLTNCYGGGAGTTNYGSVSAHAGTYLGSLYATANGQTTLQFAPAAAAGGSHPVVGLYNAYNRVVSVTMEQDSTASWTYSTTTWRALNNNSNNRITWLDGLGQSRVIASFVVGCLPAVNVTCQTGVNIDSTSATPGGVYGNSYNANLASNADDMELAAGTTYIGLGVHYAQAMEIRAFGSSTITVIPGSRMALTTFMAN